MTLEDIKKQDLLQTRSIAEACKDSPETLGYIVECLGRFFSGDYGEICQEDTDYNNADLREGEGHILARYKQRLPWILIFTLKRIFRSPYPELMPTTQ